MKSNLHSCKATYIGLLFGGSAMNNSALEQVIEDDLVGLYVQITLSLSKLILLRELMNYIKERLLVIFVILTHYPTAFFSSINLRLRKLNEESHQALTRMVTEIHSNLLSCVQDGLVDL